MKKVKVLVVGLTGGVGGVETFICNVNKHIDHSKVTMDFLVHQEINRKYIDDLTFAGGTIYQIAGIKEKPITYLRDIIVFFRNHSYDIVHLHECDASFFIYVWPVLFSRKTKLVVHSHNGDSANRGIHSVLSRIQNKRANAKWACSEIAAEWMFGEQSEENKCSIIHNGIDVESYRFDENRRFKARRLLGIREDDLVIGSIARFEEQKNHVKMVSVFDTLGKSESNTCLVLVGDGQLQAKIKTLVHEKGLDDRVLFLGIREDIPDLLSAFDIFLLPSLYEGLPFVAIEAQAASLPMVVSDAVSSEIDLTTLINRCKLDSDDSEWCKAIIDSRLSEKEREKNDFPESLKQKGFDIAESCKQIERMYLQLVYKN